MAKTMGELSKHHVKKSQDISRRRGRPHTCKFTHRRLLEHNGKIFTRRMKQQKHVHDYTNNAYQQEQDYFDTFSFESTLDRVLEMTQLGKEQSHLWENVVRASFKTDYHLRGDYLSRVWWRNWESRLSVFKVR